MEQGGSRRRASASTSLGRASSFLVHHPPAQHPYPNYNNNSSSRGIFPAQVVRPSSTSPSPAGPSPSTKPTQGTSQLPLDLLETAATRWASTAGRGSRAAPRVRSTLGPQSDVVDTGVFVCPDTVVAALYTRAGGRDDLVVTAECAGWLRVREQRTGVIRHQQQLRDGNEAACLAWASPNSSCAGGAVETSEDGAAAALQTMVAVGQLSGLVSFFALVGESLVEMPAATCVLHEAPVLSCVPLLRTSSAPPLHPEVPSSPSVSNLLLTVDADGVVALWQLQLEAKTRSLFAGLTVSLLHCDYAAANAVVSSPSRSLSSPDAPSMAGADAQFPATEFSQAGDSGPPSAPPVVISAAAVLPPGELSSCSVFATHRLVDAASGDVERQPGRSRDAQGLIYLLSYTDADGTHNNDDENGNCSLLGEGAQRLNATSLAMPSHASDTDVSASTDGTGALTAFADGDDKGWRTSGATLQWRLRGVYDIPVALRSRPENRHITISSICAVGHQNSGRSTGRSKKKRGTAAQVWAATTDGRIFIWQIEDGQYVRCLVGASRSAIHSLVCVPAASSSSATSQRKGGGGTTKALVWASHADGSVVAWSAAHYAVAEVLPVSYPPPSALEEADGADGPASAVVAVRDAVDLLRATRHAPPPPSPNASRPAGQRKCGFTLFVQPMEVVCMQRAWSVATDGTVRTWLLPAGEAAAATEEEEVEEEDTLPQNGVEGTGDQGRKDGAAKLRSDVDPAVLDAFTVQCFLQDTAEACVRERAAHELEWASQQAQLDALRERNEVLQAALQQAIGRLERVSADGLVRSSSPAHTPPPSSSPRHHHQHDDHGYDQQRQRQGRTPPSRPHSGEETRENSEDVDGRGDGDGRRPRSPSTMSDASVLSSPSTISQPPDHPPTGAAAAATKRTAATAASTAHEDTANAALVPVSPPDAIVPAALGASPHTASNNSDASQRHVQVLQQLLEELHSKLEESWSRNDDLREELLVYQLRTLEREEDIARRIRESTVVPQQQPHPSPSPPTSSATAAVSVTHDRTAPQTPSIPATPAEVPPPPVVVSPTPPHTQQVEAASPTSPLPAQHPTSAEVTAEASMSPNGRRPYRSSPSRSVEAPPTSSLVNAASFKSAPAASASSSSSSSRGSEGNAYPILAPSTPAASVDTIDYNNGHDEPTDRGNASGVTAADRFLHAAAAALGGRGGPASSHLPNSTNAGLVDREAADQGGWGDAVLHDERAPASDPLTPSRHIRAPLPPSEESVLDEEGEEPALVAAWSTSEAELSPISASAIRANNTTNTTKALRPDGGSGGNPQPPHTAMSSSSLFSYPYLPFHNSTNTSMRSHAQDYSVSTSTNYSYGRSNQARGRGGDVHSVRLYAEPAPGPLPVARSTPIRAAPLPASPPQREFRSPIIYHRF